MHALDDPARCVSTGTAGGGETNKGSTVIGNAFIRPSALKRPRGLKPHNLPRHLRGPEGPLFHGAAGIAATPALDASRVSGMPALDDPASCVSTGTARGGEANKAGTVIGNALIRPSAQKRPQGLKPPHLPRDLRGPEGPLFHGAAGIAATPALTMLRALRRRPHWTQAASLDARIGRSGTLRLSRHGLRRRGQQGEHGDRQCAHQTIRTETTTGAKAPHLPRDLRGPEGPLFHGAAGIAARPALTMLRAVRRRPHSTQAASLDARIGRSGTLRLSRHGLWGRDQQDRHGGRQCAHQTICTETTSGAKAPTSSTRLTRP